MKKMFLTLVVAAMAVSVSFGVIYTDICECQQACYENYKSKSYNNAAECYQKECPEFKGKATVCTMQSGTQAVQSK